MKKLFSGLRAMILTLIVGTLDLFDRCRAALSPRRLFFPGFLPEPWARADVYSANATKLRTEPVTKVPVNDIGARIRYLNDVYTQGAADGAIGDVIHLGAATPPVGAKIIGHLSRVQFSAGNAAATLAIGKTGAAAALLAATAITNAGGAILITPADGADDVTIAADEEIILTNAGAAIKAGQVIRLRIAYVEGT